MSGAGVEGWGGGLPAGASPLGGARGVRGGRRRRHSQGRRRLYVASIEGLTFGLVIPCVGKVQSDAPVGKDVQESQEFHVNMARGRHGTGQKGVGSAQSVGVGVTILRHLGARRLMLERVDIRGAQLTVATHIRKMVAAELVCERTASQQSHADGNRGWRP